MTSTITITITVLIILIIAIIIIVIIIGGSAYTTLYYMLLLSFWGRQTQLAVSREPFGALCAHQHTPH
jgi:hypothetical protein